MTGWMRRLLPAQRRRAHWRAERPFSDMIRCSGEMGGLWPEKKVCDGFFLAVDDVPLTQADTCIHPVVTAFHYCMQKERLHVVRRQFIPDGVSGCVIELTIENLKTRRAWPRCPSPCALIS